jgi:PadR family transcriptional regulator PadR
MNAQMKKGVIELCILKIIDHKKSSAFEILKKMKVLEVNENTIYPILRRLKNDDYLVQEKGQNDIGAPRKYYCLTQSGQDKMKKMYDDWKSFNDSVNRLLEGDVFYE